MSYRPVFEIRYNDLNAEPAWDLYRTDLEHPFPPCFHSTVQGALDCIVKDYTTFNVTIFA